jgi:hypothetical protein
MVRFYMDAHVPWPITKGLQDRGVDVLTVQQDQREDHEDALLLERATVLGRALVSMDKDFRAVVRQDYVVAPMIKASGNIVTCLRLPRQRRGVVDSEAFGSSAGRRG